MSSVLSYDTLTGFRTSFGAFLKTDGVSNVSAYRVRVAVTSVPMQLSMDSAVIPKLGLTKRS